MTVLAEQIYKLRKKRKNRIIISNIAISSGLIMMATGLVVNWCLPIGVILYVRGVALERDIRDIDSEIESLTKLL